MTTNSLLSAVKSLEDAVYYQDSKGRYASLPDQNSMRIDLLSNRVNLLAEMIQNSGGDIPSVLDKIVKYLNGSDNVEEFIQTLPTGAIITVDPSDAKKYKNIKDALQDLYQKISAASGGEGSTNINVNEGDDIYIKYMSNDPSSTTYLDDIQSYPAIFQYIYDELNFIAKYLFKRTNEFDVYDDMDV